MQLNNMSEIKSMEDCTTAVYIKDLWKSHVSGDNGKKLLLNNFCMRIEKGTIYGFLGASGCGKTTVLSCIVGLRKWDSGQILVFGREPGSKDSGIPGKTIGYMPQELALYNQLSIIETMKFYGKLYNMPDLLIRKKWELLSELLNLSKNGPQLIGELSGGQKRRASLAMAMIHSPQLLVLDEPTVGLDPVLRESIWNYLYQISGKLGTTILITTHYIEEARYSNVIGLMRQGRMLTEGNPGDLMKHYECDLLEQVVLRICRLDLGETLFTNDRSEKYKPGLNQGETFNGKSSWRNVENIHGKELTRKFCIVPSGDFDEGYQKIQRLKTESGWNHSNFLQFFQKTCEFTWVIFLILFRYPVFLLLMVMMPAIQSTITLSTIGTKPLGLPLGVINLEVDDWITACESTQNHTYIENELITGCQLTPDKELKFLSCQYLNQLGSNNLVDLIEFSTEEDARVQVELGNSWGYMIIPENFSLSFRDLLLAKQYAMNESIEGSRIPIYMDYSQFISSSFIIRHMHHSYSKFIKELAKSCSINEKIADVPLNFRKPIYGDNEDNYTAFVMPGLLLCTIFAVASSMSGMLLIDDRRQGTLSRAKLAGLSCSNVIISHIIVQGVLTIVQLAICSIILYFIFSIPFKGQLWLYVLICLASGLSGTTLGIFLGLIVDNEAKALHIGTFVSNILLLYGGIIWPSEAMSKNLQTAASILPTYLPTQSLRSVIVRGLELGHPLVWPGLLASVLWTIGLIIFSVLRFHKKI